MDPVQHLNLLTVQMELLLTLHFVSWLCICLLESCGRWLSSTTKMWTLCQEVRGRDDLAQTAAEHLNVRADSSVCFSWLSLELINKRLNSVSETSHLCGTVWIILFYFQMGRFPKIDVPAGQILLGPSKRKRNTSFRENFGWSIQADQALIVENVIIFQHIKKTMNFNSNRDRI